MLNSDLDMEGSGKLRLTLIGRTGAGKSSTGYTVLGKILEDFMMKTIRMKQRAVEEPLMEMKTIRMIKTIRMKQRAVEEPLMEMKTIRMKQIAVEEPLMEACVVIVLSAACVVIVLSAYWRAEKERRMEERRAKEERLAKERRAEEERRMEIDRFSFSHVDWRAEKERQMEACVVIVLSAEPSAEVKRRIKERRAEEDRLEKERRAEEKRRMEKQKAEKERLAEERSAEVKRRMEPPPLFSQICLPPTYWRAEEKRWMEPPPLFSQICLPPTYWRAEEERRMEKQKAEKERLAESCRRYCTAMEEVYRRKTGLVSVNKNLDKTRETLKQTSNRSSIGGNAPGVGELLQEGRMARYAGKGDSAALHVKTNETERQQTSTKALQSSRKSGGQDHSKDDNQKQKLTIVLSGSTSKSSLGHQNGRVDIYVGDRNLQSESVRQEFGIRDVISIQEITVPSDAANDPDSKLLVRMRPYGEGKDSWEHCTTQDGDVGLPEVQPLYIFHVMRGCSAFPASATWILETPDKCTPLSFLEAELEIKLVMSGSMKPAKDRQDSSGSPVARLSLQIQGREYPEVVPLSQTPLLCNGSDTEQFADTLEEKYQSEAMEK